MTALSLLEVALLVQPRNNLVDSSVLDIEFIDQQNPQVSFPGANPLSGEMPVGAALLEYIFHSATFVPDEQGPHL